MNKVNIGRESKKAYVKGGFKLLLLQKYSGYPTSEYYKVETEDMVRQIYGDKNFIIKCVQAQSLSLSDPL